MTQQIIGWIIAFALCVYIAVELGWGGGTHTIENASNPFRWSRIPWLFRRRRRP